MNRKFFSIIVITALFAVTAINAFAQEKGKVRGGLNYGSVVNENESWVHIGDIYLGYNLKDNMNVSFRLGAKDFYVYSYNRIFYNFLGSYTYYFGLRTSSLTPFIGGGLGYYKITASQQFSFQNFTENKIGGMLTAGFEFWKFRVAAEYNLIPATKINGEFAYKNSYLGITAGFYFGGGKWKKTTKSSESKISAAENLAAAKAKTEKEDTERLATAKAKAEKEDTERIAAAKAEAEKAAELERERLAALEREKTEQNKPPAVSIIDPMNGSFVEGESVKISYEVSVKAPTSVKISVDGKPVQLITDAKFGQNTAIVNIPDKDCKITIVAQNEFGASVPASVNLIRSELIFKPSLYVLAIGISNYDNPDLRLQYPAKDASDFAQAMMRQAGLLYESVDVKLLADRRATADNIREGLLWLQTETTNRDVAMLYIAGHGVNDNTGDFFFMPVNANIDKISATCVSYTDIKRTVTAIAGKMIVFMDACHSGNVFGNTLQRAGLITQAVSELTNADSGPVVYTSSTGRQFSLEAPEWNNGAFTKALVEGLTGKADLSGRKTITIKSLDYYIATRVKDLTGGKQAPTTIIPLSIPDFPIAVVPENQ